ncbi:MAG: rhomboid family intramembrane serine protease [Flavobacteriaceae bacterium]|nr:rhomboid family intramembrane serine protease [Flavobacteriaceae bacterium]
MNVLLIIVIVANVLVSIKGFKDLHFFNRYKFQILNINKGEKYRMFTSGFLHADWLHLILNMYALYLFGKFVMMEGGNFNFMIIYFGSLLAGSLYTLYVHKNEPYYSAVGASGAVMGIIYASILYYPEMTLYIFPLPIPIKGYIFGILYLLFSIYGMKKQLGNIGHAAHLGGAVAGYGLTLLLSPYLWDENTLVITLSSLPILILFILEKTGKI